MEREPLTKQELDAYLSGKLSPSEMHEIELKLSDDPFFSDAVEGFQNHPEALSGFREAQYEVQKRIDDSWTAWSFKHTLVAALAGFVVVGATMYFWQTDDTLSQRHNVLAENTSTEDEVAIMQENNPEFHITFSEPIVITDEIEQEVVEAKEIPEEDQIQGEFITENQPITVEAPASIEAEKLEKLVSEIVKIEPLEPILAEMPEAVEPAKVVKSNVKVRYADGLLIVDYSGLYTSGVEKHTITHEFNNTPAYQAHRNDERPEVTQPITQTVYVPYLDFIEAAQHKFKKNHFKGALKDYHKILKQFPDDVNALFYGGLCYYNLGKQDRAIQYFKNLKNSAVTTFYPEAEFYLALALKADGQHGKGNQILQKIAEGGGFYAQQASDMINP